MRVVWQAIAACSILACNSTPRSVPGASEGAVPILVQKSPSDPGSVEWRKPESYTNAPCEPKELDAAQKARVKVLKETFAEHDTSSLEQWLHDFGCEPNPERELGIYEAMAQAYRSYTATHRLDLAGRRDVYRVVY